MKKKKYRIFHILVLFLIAVIFSTYHYLSNSFSKINCNELLFTAKYGSGGADNSIFLLSVLRVLPILILIFLVLFALFYDITFGKKKVIIKEHQLYPISLFSNHKKILTSLLFLISFFLILNCIGFFDYISNLTKSSSIIEENYVDPKDVKIEFSEKRNLVFILVESLETTMFTKDQGGYWDYELIPELYDLLEDKDSVVFYDKNKAQTINMIEGSSWTTASIVSNLSGTPLKVNFKNKIYDSNSFMNGTYALGDLLKENGYHNELISAARTSFGGLKEYFSSHGDYSIIDESSLADYNLTISKKDYGKWGFNDHYLFETAKKRIDILAKKDKPFNMQLVTIDTHFIDGFVGDYSVDKYKRQYENAYATESKLIYDFVNWLKSKDYYKNTTIVIAGDHLTMQNDFFKGKNVKDRYVYNCFINPRNKPVKSSGRSITSLDNYPTMVYAIGGNIKGDRLGLGTNLFSSNKSLPEKYGIDKFSKEIKKSSTFYNNKILSGEE